MTDDKDIIRTIEDNAEKGFRLLMAKYKEPVYWHIRRLVVSHADAQDAAQEAFLRIFRSFKQYSGEHSFKAWIFRIAALFLLAGFFIFLLTDRMQTNRELRGRTVAGTQDVQTALPTHHTVTPVLDAEPGAGDYVRARLVSNSPSSRQYAIDVDPMLLPGDFGEIPGDGRIPIPLASVPGTDDALQRIQLRGDAFADALMMLESIRRDLTALDVPGVTVDTESRGNSLFTTIRLDSDLRLDMNAMKSDGMFEFHLMSGAPGGNDSPVVFRIEFFCE